MQIVPKNLNQHNFLQSLYIGILQAYKSANFIWTSYVSNGQTWCVLFYFAFGEDLRSKSYRDINKEKHTSLFYWLDLEVSLYLLKSVFLDLQWLCIHSYKDSE